MPESTSPTYAAPPSSPCGRRPDSRERSSETDRAGAPGPGYYAQPVSDQHVGVRRRPARVPVGRLLPLLAGLAVTVWALTLPEPARGPDSVTVPVLMPTWSAPETV